VATAGEITIGYVVLDYSFYENGFISMLCVHPDYRRQGVGERLMQQVEGVCRTEKLFTSTNLSNTAMQRLLARLGYVLSGVIHNLDEDDPELVYFKLLKPKAV
jgi:ribosomal protein S18 acetylase RimI-like enzyme